MSSMNNYALFVRRLREERQLSQEWVANKICISRPTYIAIEKGTKELSLSEAEKLSNIFQIS